MKITVKESTGPGQSITRQYEPVADRLDSVINERLTAHKAIRVKIRPGTRVIQAVFDRWLYELPNEKDKPEGELFRCEFNYGSGWFGGGGDDTRKEGKNTARPGQRMLWHYVAYPLPTDYEFISMEYIGLRVWVNRPFDCRMHIDFYGDKDPERLKQFKKDLAQIEVV